MRWPAMVGIMANGEGSLLGGLCFQTWCAAGSFCLVSILSVVADTRCRQPDQETDGADAENHWAGNTMQAFSVDLSDENRCPQLLAPHFI